MTYGRVGGDRKAITRSGDTHGIHAGSKLKRNIRYRVEGQLLTLQQVRQCVNDAVADGTLKQRLSRKYEWTWDDLMAPPQDSRERGKQHMRTRNEMDRRRAYEANARRTYYRNKNSGHKEL